MTYTNDLSHLIQCQGYLVRTWTATDACGNTAPYCIQNIDVLPTPCDFTINATAEPASCPNPGDIAVIINGLTDSLYMVVVTGPASVTLPDQPPGLVQLGTLVHVMPGMYTIEVFSSLGCSQTTVVDVPYLPPYEFFILQVTQPGCSACDDGSVQFQTGPSAIFPLMVFVNGTPIGLVSANPFIIGNLLPGVYTFHTVDNGGNGCPSASLSVVLEAMAVQERGYPFLGLQRPMLLEPAKTALSRHLQEIFSEHPDVSSVDVAISFKSVVGCSVPVSPQVRFVVAFGVVHGTVRMDAATPAKPWEARQNTLGMRWSPPNRDGQVRMFLDGSLAQLVVVAQSKPSDSRTFSIVEMALTPGLIWNINKHMFLEARCGIQNNTFGYWRMTPCLFVGIR